LDVKTLLIHKSNLICLGFKKLNYKICILGGTGFIGYHIAKKCLSKKWSVHSVSINKPKKLRFLNGVRYFLCDVSSKKNLEKIFNKNNYDYVINLSGYVDHSKSKLTYKSHYIGCRNLVDLLKTRKIKKFIQLGTSLEYGSIKSPQQEPKVTTKDTKKKLKSVYSNSKLKATNCLVKAYKKYNFPCIIFRLYLTYGPRQDFNRLIPIVIKNCFEGNNFPTSSGNQIRDFIYIDDLVDLVVKSLKSKIKGEIINLGSGKPTKVKKIIKFIESAINKGKPLFGVIELRKDEQLKIYPNISKAKQFFNWKPKISIFEGLKKTIKYYKNENSR